MKGNPSVESLPLGPAASGWWYAVGWDGLPHICSKEYYRSEEWTTIYWMLRDPWRIGDDGA